MSGDFSLENFTELGHMFLSPAFCWDWQLLVVTLQAERKQVSLVRSRQRSKFQVPQSTDPGEKQRTPKKVKEHTDTLFNFETITIREQVWDTGKETKKQNQTGNECTLQGEAVTRSAKQNCFFCRDDLKTTSSSWYQLTESAVFKQGWSRALINFFSLARPPQPASKLRLDTTGRRTRTYGFPLDRGAEKEGHVHAQYLLLAWSPPNIQA